jgi:hypothetical protein
VSILVRQASALARQWVVEEMSSLPGFQGAYIAGSVSWLPDDAIFPATSDLDINVVFSGQPELNARDKFLYHDLLLEVTPLSLDQLQSPDLILSHYHLAGGFRSPSILLDPSGRLSALQQAVARGYARKQWVRRRCEHARREVLDGLAGIDGAAPFPQQVMGWLFSTGKTTHVLLVAGLQNPTVRRRYGAVRDLLAKYGRLPFHETLLELLGSARISRTRAEEHLAALTEVFNVAAAVIKSPFSFASDISEIARPLTIDGSRDLIERGYHREAMFWIAVTHSRCRLVLHADAPAALNRRFDADYRRLLADLGIASPDNLRQRGAQVKASLPRLREVAEAIMEANSDIERAVD